MSVRRRKSSMVRRRSHLGEVVESVLFLRVNKENAMRWCCQLRAQDRLVETYPSKKVFLKYCTLIIVNLHCCE